MGVHLAGLLDQVWQFPVSQIQSRLALSREENARTELPPVHEDVCAGRSLTEIIEPDKRPLISFCLFAYNQERFIREAVEGAFAQSYSPLEIILSDDCSTDRTFDIMREMATGYCGPHCVRLNRNERNLGVGEHVNRVVALARGYLIVGAAGDDISLPERVQELCIAWQQSRGNANSIVSGWYKIDEAGSVLRADLKNPKRQFHSLLEQIRGGGRICGATHAFTKKTFEVFGPLDEEIVAEDRVIGLRSHLIGSIVEVPRCLVRYRAHEGNLYNVAGSIRRTSLEAWARLGARACRRDIPETLQMLKDMNTAKAMVDPFEFEQIAQYLRNKHAYYSRLRKNLESPSRWLWLFAVLDIVTRYYWQRARSYLSRSSPNS
jgi:glycosyltransferase involved in cell wall biosynthesis